MKSASSAFLVDTNVLVYAYDPAENSKQELAIAVLERLGARRTGSLSAQVLNYYQTSVYAWSAIGLKSSE